MILPVHPILTCDEAGAFEQTFFGGDEAREWAAMQAAGRAVAGAVLDDYKEIGGFPPAGRILVLVGKGHNGGDALLAAQCILQRFPAARAEVILAMGERALRPLAARAWRELAQAAGDRVVMRSAGGTPASATAGGTPALPYDLCLDGVFGFQFRPPLDPGTAALLARVNALPVRLRAAVDLPSGLGAPDAFRADFTYATGIVKTPLLTLPNAGRVRYLDLGFFAAAGSAPAGPGSATPATTKGDFVLTADVLAPLRALRSPHTDKRSYGHLCVMAGSLRYPGAALMSVQAALRSGAGLVTALVPESLVASFAARAPAAMWIGCPVTPEGGLAMAGRSRLQDCSGRATAWLLGPGLGREPETMALLHTVIETAEVPLVLDADALQPDLVRAGRMPRVLTPHAGEFARIAGGMGMREFSAESGATVVLKGPVTRMVGGAGLR
ncbi:MAG: bifunctional ADP-dependent NAD(P)H-hydrate dehydratase/NAD(P)H-hydrate epimerase, partial [Verrucomicrobiota bacterium]